MLPCSGKTLLTSCNALQTENRKIIRYPFSCNLVGKQPLGQASRACVLKVMIFHLWLWFTVVLLLLCGLYSSASGLYLLMTTLKTGMGSECTAIIILRGITHYSYL